MRTKLLSATIIGLALLTAEAVGPSPAAHAAQCLSAGEARAAVQSGQAVSLSKLLRKIRNSTGGEIVPPPQLCMQGGLLVYNVNVLNPKGKVKKLTVDASSGNIIGR